MNPNDYPLNEYLKRSQVTGEDSQERFTVEFPVERLLAAEGTCSVELTREEAERLRESITACLEEVSSGRS